MAHLIRYRGGATRSRDGEETRFDLVPPAANLRRARRWALGARTHGANNWRQGMPIATIINHLERHWQRWRSGDRTDDHLAAVSWGIDALMECERLGWTGRTGERTPRRKEKRR